MDERGNIIILIAIGILIIIILPPIVMVIWPPAKFIFQIAMIFILYSIVRGYLGTGPLTLIVSAVLIWFLVFKYTYIFASIYVFQLLLGVQFLSVVIWGIGTQLRPR